MFVLVAGPPGSGTTTLAAPLAHELGLSLRTGPALATRIRGLAQPSEAERQRGPRHFGHA